ncbi:MAG: hypothetical protein ACM33T_05595 [Solirubrobacterales bacterium]
MAVIAALRRGCQALVWLLCAIAAALSSAMAAECPPREVQHLVPKLVLRTEVATVATNNHRSRTEISRLAGDASYHTMGLTRTNTEFRLRPSMQRYSYRDGRSCVLLDEVEAVWRIGELVVDIAREYQPGSCEYQAIKTHEAEHVAIARRTFAEYEPRMRTRLRDLVTGFEPTLVGGDPERYANQRMQQLFGEAKSLIAAFESDLRQRQAAIDTPASYRAVAAKCKGW